MLRLILEFVRSFKVSREVISLDTFEWRHNDVMLTRLPNDPQWNSYAIPRGELYFSLWNLAHAVVKADYLIQGNFLFPSIGFLLSGNNLLKLSSNNNLRTVDNINCILNDITLTSYAGRLGQGITLLLAHKLGYAFVGHLASDPSIKTCSTSHSTSGKNKKPKIADFLFEDNNQNRTIFESKTSFTLQTNDTSYIKGNLKSSLLGQVNPWVNNIVHINKGYAVHSALRGISQYINSSVSYVDPSSKDNIRELDLRTDWVKAKNYASWFSFLGYTTVSNNLFNINTLSDAVFEKTKSYSFRIVRFYGYEFLVLRMENIGGNRVIIAGIELNLMKAIESYLVGKNDLLMKYEGVGSHEQFFYHRHDISLFPDGTFIGELHKGKLTRTYSKCMLPE